MALVCLFFTGCVTVNSQRPLESREYLEPLAVRPANWQRFVSDRSRFQLGEPDAEPQYQFTYGYEGSSFEFNGWTVKQYYRSYGTYPMIIGDTALIPVAADFAWQFLDMDDWNTWWFVYNLYVTEHYQNLILQHNGSVGESRRPGHPVTMESRDEASETISRYWLEQAADIALTKNLTEYELDFAEKEGVEIIVKPICYDSLVFITHKNNPVDSLSIEQLQKIYTGEITNWKQVGGRNQKITAYQHDKQFDVYAAMEEKVMQGLTTAKPPMVTAFSFPHGFYNVVAKYKNNPRSIGYTYKYYADKLYADPDIKIIKINGAQPSDENVRNGSYPLTEPYNAVIRAADAEAVGGRFMNWILSEEGQKSIKQAGYVTLN